MSTSEALNWHPVRELAGRVERGEPLALTGEVITLLRRTAGEVAISDAEVEQALGSVQGATAVLLKAHDRIRDGSRRLNRALHRMYQLRDSGDLEGARQQMRDVLTVEVVPHYRNIAQGQLDMLDDWEAGRNP